jgi:hypothetical protein
MWRCWARTEACLPGDRSLAVSPMLPSHLPLEAAMSMTLRRAVLGCLAGLTTVGGALVVVESITYFGLGGVRGNGRDAPELSEVGGWGIVTGMIAVLIYVVGALPMPPRKANPHRMRVRGRRSLRERRNRIACPGGDRSGGGQRGGQARGRCRQGHLVPCRCVHRLECGQRPVAIGAARRTSGVTRQCHEMALRAAARWPPEWGWRWSIPPLRWLHLVERDRVSSSTAAPPTRSSIPAPATRPSGPAPVLARPGAATARGEVVTAGGVCVAPVVVAVVGGGRCALAAR